MPNSQYPREACKPHPQRLLGLQAAGRLNAEHKGLDTPSEDDDEPHKQHAEKQKTFPLEVKTVNSLHVVTQKHSVAPAIPGHRPQTGDRTHQNSP